MKEGMVIILVYVDYLLITDSSVDMIIEANSVLHHQFKLNGLGELKYFLGIGVLRSHSGMIMIMNQRKYLLELIFDMGLSGANPSPIPLEANMKLTSIEYDKEK